MTQVQKFGLIVTLFLLPATFMPVFAEPVSTPTEQSTPASNGLHTATWSKEQLAKFRDIAARQLSMNPQTLERLRIHGVKDDSLLSLDFFYFSDAESSAESLRGFLSRETDYSIAKPKRADSRWSLHGTTRLTHISREIMDEWVKYMTAAGVEHGCEFDGWGAEVP